MLPNYHLKETKMSSFWSLWVIVITLGTIALITWILFANRTTQGNADETTGHEYDGIVEYDNALPAWWFNMFVVSVVIALVYLVLYPGLGNYKGVLGWTSANQWQAFVDEAEAAFNQRASEFMKFSAQELAEDRDVVRMGQRIFKSNCSVCHGVDAKGTYAFPDLTDNDWLYGGSEANIKHSIMHGRNGIMPAQSAILGDDLDAMVEYVSLIATDAAANHPMKAKFEMVCAVCHAKDGSGNQLLGAPNLRDDIWLYGGSPSEIKQTIAHGRNGQMPAHKDILSESRIHLVVAYLFSLQSKD